MTENKVIEPGCKIWDDTIEFAENCSWGAGAYLAHKMEVNDFADKCFDGTRIINNQESGIHWPWGFGKG